jgi:hypothetical protein
MYKSGWLRNVEIPRIEIYELRHSATDVIKEEYLTARNLQMATRKYFETSVNIYQS